MLSHLVERRHSKDAKLTEIDEYGMAVHIDEVCKILDKLPKEIRTDAAIIFLRHGQIEPKNLPRALRHLSSDEERNRFLKEIVKRGIDGNLIVKLFQQMKTQHGEHEAINTLYYLITMDHLPHLAQRCGGKFIYFRFREKICGNLIGYAPGCRNCVIIEHHYNPERSTYENPHCIVHATPRNCEYCQNYENMTIQNWEKAIRSDNNKRRTVQVAEKKEVPPKPIPHPIETAEDDSALEKEHGVCVICLTARYNTVNLHCGHACFCIACAKEFMKNDQKDCPICRTKLTEIKQIYLT